MSVQLLSFGAPYGCLWCGTAQRSHGRRWAPSISDTHTWVQPPLTVVLDRMRRRRTARLAAEPTKYHATTGWTADPGGESGSPFCADCKTDGCRRWLRVQDRLDRQRWQLSGMPYGTATGGWGGDVPF